MQEQKDALSERELEILKLVATGAANKEIARQLVISPNTVKVHLRNIFAKIGVASRTEATLYALKIGLVKPEAVPEVQPVEEPQAAAVELPPTAEAPLIPSFPPKRVPLRWPIGAGVILLLALIAWGINGSRKFMQPMVTPTVARQTPTAALSTNRWRQMSQVPSARKGMGAVEYENSFYLVGGETQQGIDGALLLFTPASNSWKTLSSKPTPVTDVQAALVGEKIYVPGGRTNGGQASDVLEVYDPRRNSWQKKAPLPVALSGFALASFEGQLYLFGGKTNQGYSASVFIYDPKEDNWQKGSPLSSPRAYAGAAVMNGKIYIIGGFDGKNALRTNEVYFPDRDANGETPWENSSPLPQGRYAMGVTHLAGFIYLAVGMGQPENSAPTPILQYFTVADQWSEINPSSILIGAQPALLSSGNYIYAFGGQTADGLSKSSQSYQALYTISMPFSSNNSDQ
jgi:DNA-binding CsgD family transcriptional regulator